VEPPNVVDISVKALFRERPEAVLRLAGWNVDPGHIRAEDSNINLPELRADSDQTTGDAGESAGGLSSARRPGHLLG